MYEISAAFCASLLLHNLEQVRSPIELVDQQCVGPQLWAAETPLISEFGRQNRLAAALICLLQRMRSHVRQSYLDRCFHT
jgi:hypothetical protein